MSEQQPEPRLALEQGSLQCPVTALAFFKAADGQRYVVSGEDSWLGLYRPDGCRPCGRLRIFASQPIHGIHASPAGLLVWGAHLIASVPAADVDAALAGSRIGKPLETEASDWIYDASLSPHDSQTGVLVTAHNEIVPFSLGNGGRSISLKDLVSPSRPILYSAAVSWTSPTCILVAAGTVFGEIVVWECHLRPGHPPLSQVLFVLTGHEGSIFGVSISPELDLGTGAKRRLLATCSDDRTIRIWDVTTDSLPSEAFDEARLREARETGFREGPEGEVARHADATRCLAVAMGHVSRIWHVKFWCPATTAGTSAGRPVSVYSFGEDATAQRWELGPRGADPQTTLPKTLTNAGRFLCHSGKHIWSVAVTDAEEPEPVIITGGADGRISLLSLAGEWDATGSGSTKNVSSTSLSYQDVLQSLQLDKDHRTDPIRQGKRTPKSGFLRYAFLSEDRLLVSTLSGEVLVGHISQAQAPSWAAIDIPEAVRGDLASYNVVKGAGEGAAFLGSASGRVYLYHERHGMQEVAALSRKIADLLPLSRQGPYNGAGEPARQHSAGEGVFAVLVATVSDSRATLLTVAVSLSGTSVESVPVTIETGIATSVGRCGQFLVIGTRSGTIAVYRETASGYVHETSRHDRRDKDAITSVVTLPPLDGQTETSFLTTCRDGRYRIYEIHGDEEAAVLRLQHESSPPLGPDLEGAGFAQTRDGELDLIIYGFRSKNFVVWNETRQQELAAVACGGAHRSFDFTADTANPERLRFVYTKASRVSIYSQSRAPLRAIKQGGHGREIRAVAASANYLATAAEDTCIRIWGRQAGASEEGPRCHSVLQDHAAGIQCLRWFGEEYLISSAGNEELFVWRVTRPRSKYQGLAVVREASYPGHSPDRDLRVVSFDVGRMSNGRGGMLLSLAFSNSALRTYRYSEADGFQLLAEGQYTGTCLTQIRHLPIPGAFWAVLTASTDGHVVVWGVRDQVPASEGRSGRYELMLATKIHQNTVKSLDVRGCATASGDAWQVVTGGDDNALGILDIARPEEEGSFSIVRRARVKDAHAAAITGVVVLEKIGSSTLVATASNDQRTKVWRIVELGNQGPQVALLDSQHSAIADPGDLELLAPGELMVGGVGMEAWKWPLP